MRSARVAAAVAGTFAALAGAAAPAQVMGTHAAGVFTMGTAQALPTSDGGTEPRETVVSTGAHPGYYVISNSSGTATVWESNDGATGWHETNTTGIANQTSPTIDVDIVSMPAGGTHPGRLIANELDSGGLNFRTSYSDDGGATWTVSGVAPANLNTLPGGQLVDQDRNWLATGPGDTVYLLFHNLASGTVNHNMYVETSTDAGANFGPPIPTTTPGTQAYTDLQCADSGGPSNLFVNQKSGRVYAVFGTRSAPAGGGCAASVTGSFEVNVVAATRIWVASAPAAGAADPTQWTQSLAVDDASSGQIVGMQLGPAAIDSGGNVYVLYPESPNAYPNYDGAAIRLVHASETDISANPFGLTGPTAQVWSKPVTVAPGGGAGHLLPHLVAGGPGQVDMAYFEGTEIPGSTPPTTANWFLETAQTLDALDATPVIAYQRVNYPGGSPKPAYSGFTASQMMGACGTGPAAGVENGTICSRSTDVWGVALDGKGAFQVTWPVAPATTFGCSSCNDTFVTTQTDGPLIPAGTTTAVVAESPLGAVGLLGVGVVGAAVLARRRRGRRPV